MSIENQEAQLRKSREASAERARENRESKEGKEMDEQAKAAAAMERADFLTKEIKQSNQQIKNIVIHMQQVLQAIKALRQQLQLAGDDDISSVEQDKHVIEQLKKKIASHKDELIKMKDELITAQTEELRNGEDAGLSDQLLHEKATAMVEEIMALVENE